MRPVGGLLGGPHPSSFMREGGRREGLADRGSRGALCSRESQVPCYSTRDWGVGGRFGDQDEGLFGNRLPAECQGLLGLSFALGCPLTVHGQVESSSPAQCLADGWMEEGWMVMALVHSVISFHKIPR